MQREIPSVQEPNMQGERLSVQELSVQREPPSVQGETLGVQGESLSVQGEPNVQRSECVGRTPECARRTECAERTSECTRAKYAGRTPERARSEHAGTSQCAGRTLGVRGALLCAQSQRTGGPGSQPDQASPRRGCGCSASQGALTSTRTAPRQVRQD